MKNVLVLGGSGMLGSMLVDFLSRDPAITLTASVRDGKLLDEFEKRYPYVRWTQFHFSNGKTSFVLLDGHHWIINAIGITKPLIHDDNPEQVETAIQVNSLLPHYLGEAARERGVRVLQIATDCVYSGAKGGYREADLHDALDVYGKTKSLGETYLDNVHHLRCSIIGPEPKEFKFLLEWFRRQPKAALLKGFTNHRWNGVTTLQFARLCNGIIQKELELPHLHHVVPAAPVTKAQMLHHFARAYDRLDVMINEVEASSTIDRTLTTSDVSLNAKLWRAAGYEQPPDVAEMISEVAQHEYCGLVQE